MNNTTPLLSIIMPCYNALSTFERAIESILMQKTSFDYEIIIVDDGSTDDSSKVFKSYELKHDFIRVLSNSENSGNAVSFYTGLSQARGKFFCVLDGDDYYSIKDKLQRQIDFFSADIKEEYVATAHYFVFSIDDRVSVPYVSAKTEFNYVDLLTQNIGGYYHTSTYMYRNIFIGNVPDFLKKDVFRGDTARLFFHLMYSNKKVKILNFVGSVYVYSYQGIWTRMDEADQAKRNVSLFKTFANIVNSAYEERALTESVDIYAKEDGQGEGEYTQFSAYSIDEYISKIQLLTATYAYKSEGFVFKGFYYSVYLDSLLSTFGHIYRNQHPEYIQKHKNKNTIVIVSGRLNPNGGGIFKEINELIDMYHDYFINILLTDTDDLSEDVLFILNKNNNVHVHWLPNECESKMRYISEKFIEISPEKAYFYTAHDNPYAIALMQSGVCKNICIFSFDHGFICGISNPELDCIIAKRHVDYIMLNKKFADRLVYIPTWHKNKSKNTQKKYQPFREHEKLITACAAARYYKVKSSAENSYIDMIVELLGMTGGIHYHFGIIPQEELEIIWLALRKKGILLDRFINITWVESIAEALMDYNVDIFIEPFPIVSYKITLESLSIGVPVIAQNTIMRMSKLDFIYEGCLLWRTKEDFIQKLCGLDANTLEEHSKKSIEYFKKNHDIDVVTPFFMEEKMFGHVKDIYFADDVIQEITEFSRLFNLPSQINFTFEPPAVEEPVKLEEAPVVAEETPIEIFEIPIETQEDISAVQETPTETREPLVRKFFKSLRYEGFFITISHVFKKLFG